MALYDSCSIGTANNQVVFNDISSTPYFRVQSRAPQRRNVRELDIPIPFESGIADYRTYMGQYGYVIKGTMYPSSESASDLGLEKLRKLASVDIAQEDALSDDGYVPYIWQEFTRQKQLFVKVLYVNVSDNTKQGLIKDFEIICKIKDPTIFGYPMQSATTLEADPTATGEATYSFTYPVVYGATLLNVSDVALNNGDSYVYPVGINVYGPITNPTITNTTTGEYITLASTTLSSQSDQLVIAYDKDSVSVTLNGINRLSKVTNDSTFFKLRPGANVIELSGSSVGSGAYLDLSYYSGWPLS